MASGRLGAVSDVQVLTGCLELGAPGLFLKVIVPQAAEQIMKKLAGSIGSESSTGLPVTHGVMLLSARCCVVCLCQGESQNGKIKLQFLKLAVVVSACLDTRMCMSLCWLFTEDAAGEVFCQDTWPPSWQDTGRLCRGAGQRWLWLSLALDLG